MKFWLGFLITVPLIAASLIRWLVSGRERAVSKLASLTKIMVVVGTAAVLALWASGGFTPVEVSLGDFIIGGYQLPILFFLDSTSVTFLVLIALISAVIIRYCRYYLHREEGYARFFITIFLFISGMNLIVTAGTLDLLFAGWEMVGISSFLLIGFYRERALPVRNALRSYVVYRICDVGLLLGIWMAHVLWRDPRLSFLSSLSPEQARSVGALPLLGLSLLLTLAAAGKSAQFPFCDWLPRAMEGPTPSSAIFYGALSIHAGVFLLIRLFPVWHPLFPARVVVGSVGILSACLATLSGRTQSNIKGQLAYGSITQVGLMLLELALGLRSLALLHATANAFLKCYQLLVSPSVVAQLLRIQGTAGAGFFISDWSLERGLPRKWRSSFYVLALNEGYLQPSLSFLVVRPISRLASATQRFFPPPRGVLATGIVLAVVAAAARGRLPAEPGAAAALALLMFTAALVGLGEQSSAARTWNAVGTSIAATGLFPLVAAPEARAELAVYFAGALPGWLLGRACLFSMGRHNRERLSLREYKGRAAESPGASRWLFVSILALCAFPITPTFVGEDLLLHQCTGALAWMAGVIALTYAMNGITLVRLYSKLCLGSAGNRAASPDSAPAPSLSGVPEGARQMRQRGPSPAHPFSST